jgi:hypothetical protein
MAKLIRKTVPASTLIEVLIAMVIIMVVFVISIKVFNNVLYSGVSLKKLRIQNQLNILSKDVKRQGHVPEQVVVIDSVTYEYLVEDADMGLSRLEIKANENGKSLGSTKCLFQPKENKKSVN